MEITCPTCLKTFRLLQPIVHNILVCCPLCFKKFKVDVYKEKLRSLDIRTNDLILDLLKQATAINKIPEVYVTTYDLNRRLAEVYQAIKTRPNVTIIDQREKLNAIKEIANGNTRDKLKQIKEILDG